MVQTIREMRGHIPALQKQAYLETASTGLVPDFIYDMARHYQAERYLKGGDSTWIYEDGQVLGSVAMIERSRRAVAAMIGGEARNICFGGSSSQLYSIVTAAIRLEPGDNVVLPENGWAGGRFAWQLRAKDGVEVRYAKRGPHGVTPEDYIRCCDGRTKVVGVNYVESSTGQRFDMETLGACCAERGIITAVDGVQALGVLRIDVKKENIDLLVGNDYKWMMNFCGTGYACVSDRLLGIARNRQAGWFSAENPFNVEKPDYIPKEGAGQFEQGFPNTPGVCGLGMIAEQYAALGGEHIERTALELARYLRARVERIPGVFPLYDLPEEACSAIVWLGLERPLTQEQLRAAGIALELRHAAGGAAQTVRAALHYYNNRDDVDRLCDLLAHTV